MNRYIRCCYCGTILGEIKGFEEIPSSAYCISCFNDRDNLTSMDELDILIGEVE